jgi:uncharacterized membrane protein (UPF0136 family)
MAYLISLYGIFILIGGILGHIRAASTVSLVMGILSGGLLLIAAGAVFGKQKWGIPLALIVTFILDTFFSYRFLTTLNFIPSGLLALVSLIVLILLALQIRSIKSVNL